MVWYEYEVKEAYSPVLSGTIEASSEKAAREELKEIYAMELGTTEDVIEVTIITTEERR